MKCAVIISISFCLFIYPDLCSAYEPDTHQRLSNAAALASVLVQNSPATHTNILKDFGLKEYTDFTQQFPDSQDGETVYLDPEKQVLFKAVSFGNIQYLIQAGAALEDEFPRSLFHFYDPIPGHLGPLNINGVPTPYTAPDWAVEDSLLPLLGQSYSLKDARESLYKALTSTDQGDRNQAFGDLFLSIGHAIHLVQDSAQPQHVRNDMHCDADICKEGESILKATFGSDAKLYNPSLYESYIYENANVTDYSGLLPVELPTARSYWKSLDNKGLAQFTNENFISAGTNFHLGTDGSILSDVNYTLPSPTNLSGTEPIDQVYAKLNRPVPAQIAQFCGQLQSSCDISFVSTDVIDSYSVTSETNSRASSYSIFDQDLEEYGAQKLFTLNALNFRMDWKYLLPRAISYSSGLINYFFRGRLDIQPDPDNPGGYLVTNKSRYPMSDGTLELFYDATDGNRYSVSGASWSNVTMAPAGGNTIGQYPIQFNAPINPIPANSGQYMLVFKGKIGSEDGIAGKLFGNNTLLYTTVDSYCHSVYLCSSTWEFSSDFNFDSLRTTSTHDKWITSMAVYDGIDYTADLYASYPTPGKAGCPATIGKINNKEFISFTHLCDEPATLIEEIDVNSKYVYLFAPTFYYYATSNIYIYDHVGNYVGFMNDMPVQTLGGGFAVNDTRMCMSGFADGNISAATLLTDLNGNFIARWPGDYDLGGGPCALTKDRLYVLAWSIEGESFLNVYDMNGGLIASIDLPNSNMVSSAPISNVSASDNQIYLSVGCVGDNCDGDKIVIYDRILKLNPDGTIASEEFIRGQDAIVPWYTNPYWGDNVVVDKKDILGEPDG